MREHLDAFSRHLASARSSRTQHTYAATLALLAASLETALMGPRPLERCDIEAFLARPRKDGAVRSASTMNQELAALRAFVKFAKRDLGWTHDPTEGLAFQREPPRSPAVLSVFEIHRFFRAAAGNQEPVARARDLALLCLLSQDGVRVNELVGLDVGQVDLASATLLAVRAKGGRIDDKPLNAATVAALAAWLGVRAEIALPEEQALFISARGQRLSVRAVQRLFERLRAMTGTAKRVTPHTMRHSWATIALTLGIDLATIADQLGHEDVNTTRKYYMHLVDERRRQAVRKLEIAIPPELRGGSTPASERVSAAPGDPMRTARPLPSKPLDVQHGLDDGAEPGLAA